MNCNNTEKYISQQPHTEHELQEEVEESIDKNDSEYEEISSDEEVRLADLNKDIDNIMEEVFGVPL